MMYCTNGSVETFDNQREVFDLHCDTIDLLGMRDWEPYIGYGCQVGDEGFVDLCSNKAAISLERMQDFAWTQAFAIWIPDLYESKDALRFYMQARDWFYAQADKYSDCIEQVRDARTIGDIHTKSKVAAILTVENGSPVGLGSDIVREFARDGVKMVTLTWNGKNPLGSGHDTSEGLSDYGKKIIKTLEDERIVVDVSHLNDEGFKDLLGIAKRPFIASHSNSRVVCDVPRNRTDDQFRAIRDSGGLAGLNYYRSFITTRDIKATGEVTFDELAAHVEHFLDLDGENTLALGSDWDGSDVPAWLTPCDTIAALRARFAERFGEVITQKMFCSNTRGFFVRNETL